MARCKFQSRGFNNMNEDIKHRLLVEGTRKREDISYCMRMLKLKKWSLEMYQAVMKKNIENLNRQEREKLKAKNKKWYE